MSRGKTPRNASCPCGSGLKYKRCCLEDATRLESLAVLASLSVLFPLLRPTGRDFDDWVCRALAASPAPASIPADLIDEGLAVLEKDDVERIVGLAAAAVPDLWARLRGDLHDDDELHEVLLTGAVFAALGEERALHPDVLALLEASDDLGADPLEALALALDATALWSVKEATAAEEAVAGIPDYLDEDTYERRSTGAIAQVVAGCWSDPHRRRLETLVTRVQAQLPVAGFPRASRALDAACRLAAADPGSATQLASMLLWDALDPWWQRELGIAA